MGGIGQFLISTSSWVALVRLIGEFGSAAVAGYTIAIRVILVTILPSWGLGQNLGAGQPDRAERSVWTAGRYNFFFMIAVAAVFITFAELVIRVFNSEPEMVMVQAFNGAGDTTTPTVINLFCYWLFQIPLAYVLAFWAGLGSTGVFLAITIAESVLTLVDDRIRRLHRQLVRGSLVSPPRHY